MQKLGEHHEHLISHEPFATATEIANALGEAIAEELTGCATPPGWHDGAEKHVTFEIGSVTVATDFLIARLSEEPVNQP